MATFLDIGVFSYFSIIFLFLLVFTVTFAFLNFMKIWGKETQQGWNALIALSISVIAIMSRQAVGFISFVTPWFIVLFFVLFFILFAMRMMGGADGMDMKGVLGEAWPWILTLSIVIVLFGLGNALGQDTLKYTTPDAPDGAQIDAATDGSGEEISADGAGSATGAGSTATTDFQQNLYATLFHPKILGMFFLLIIATVTIAFMAQRTT